MIYSSVLFIVIFNYFLVITVQFESLRTVQDNASMEKLVTVDGLCDETNGLSEYEDEDGSTIDEDEYDEEQPDVGSIGKKLWTFFTT